ncbi:hypothetical protein GZ77_06900 [Endozoicomonas montiporae]|uniref:Uncharacterized protein n=2 Tax=Endozoicomonas montiporae TaxID=1027273 RepID=A0A081N6U5_9GAMM|nr:hypothetical protein GZ77_06900 [Endozoicomonas montiporae]
MNNLLFLVIFSALLSEQAFARTFEFYAFHDLRFPNHVLISQEGYSEGFHKSIGQLSDLTGTKTASIETEKDTFRLKQHGLSRASELNGFAWHQIFSVDDSFVGYKFLVEIGGCVNSLVPEWLAAGLSAAVFLVDSMSSDKPVMPEDEISHAPISSRSGPGSAASDNTVYFTPYSGNGLSSPHQLTINPQGFYNNNNRPPEDNHHIHTRGNVCHHLDCKGKRCIEATDITGECHIPRDLQSVPSIAMAAGIGTWYTDIPDGKWPDIQLTNDELPWLGPHDADIAELLEGVTDFPDFLLTFQNAQAAGDKEDTSGSPDSLRSTTSEDPGFLSDDPLGTGKTNSSSEKDISQTENDGTTPLDGCAA